MNHSRITTFLIACGLLALAASASAQAVTFSKHIAPIFQAHCQQCHRPGEPAPMSLLDYESSRPWAKSIKKTVTARTMPPWFADPAHGTFVNDARLSEAEIATISKWVDGGAVEGNKADLPKPLVFSKGWAIGEPDLVLTVEKPYEIPAEGIIQYQEFWLVFPVDAWVTKMEIRPSNRQAAHHINMYREEPLGNGKYAFRDFVTGFIPGGGPTGYPSDIAVLMKKGTKLMLQTHYVTTGEATTDQTSVGFIFAREPVMKEMHLSMIGNYTFEIPPGDPNFEVQAKWTALQDVEVFGAYAHMHLRGKDFKFIANLPDGQEKTLISIPKYDFEWQLGYIYKDRILLPKRTSVQAIAHLDNSAGNPFNPDPTATVKYGEQTFDEMMIGALFWTKVGEDLREGKGKEFLWTGPEKVGRSDSESEDVSAGAGN